MKKRFDYFFDIAQFPLVALFIATLMIGIGNLMINSQIAMWSVTDSNVILISSMLKSLGILIIRYFPLLLLMNATSRKFDDSICSFLSLISYFTLLIVTMFMASEKLPIDAYATNLGIQVTVSQFSSLGVAVKYPLQLGIIASILCYFIVKNCYLKTRNRRSYGFFSFVDKNTAALISCIILSVIMGVFISYAWFYVVKVVYLIFAFIADDITNPFNLFVYGSLEKILGIFNMVDIPHNLFYFGEYGGSWLDSFGHKFIGDVGIWTAQSASGITTSGIGRFITPLYVINIFAIPGYILALFTLYTNRFEKRKFIIFALFAMLASSFMGNSMPFDIFMLCASPLLFGFHVFISGAIYAIMQWAKVYIGYSYIGEVALATPGSIADLFVYLKSINMINALQYILFLGIFVFCLYFLLTRLYYQFLSIDMFQSGYEKSLVNDVLNALGGSKNIKVIDSNFLKLLIQVNDESIVDVSKLRRLCYSRVFESKTGYVLYFYSSSHIIHYEINKILKNNKNLLNNMPNQIT